MVNRTAGDAAAATDWQGRPVYCRRRDRADGRNAQTKPRMSDLLEGVRGPSTGDDRALARALARRGQIAYAVVDPQRPKPRPAAPGEHRVARRRRTRMRSAKILDSANAFLCDCLIYDRSATGLRITLARDLGLPRQFQVHDDESGAVESVATVWRRGATLGVRFSGFGAAALKPSERAALRGRYYAVRD